MFLYYCHKFKIIHQKSKAVVTQMYSIPVPALRTPKGKGSRPLRAASFLPNSPAARAPSIAAASNPFTR